MLRKRDSSLCVWMPRELGKREIVKREI
jgi:hypothetical protein